MTLSRQGRAQEAAKYLQEALRLAPNNPDIHRNLGAALAMLGRLDEAEAPLWRAIRLNLNDVVAFHNLANVLLQAAYGGSRSQATRRSNATSLPIARNPS